MGAELIVGPDHKILVTTLNCAKTIMKVGLFRDGYCNPNNPVPHYKAHFPLRLL